MLTPVSTVLQLFLFDSEFELIQQTCLVNYVLTDIYDDSNHFFITHQAMIPEETTAMSILICCKKPAMFFIISYMVLKWNGNKFDFERSWRFTYQSPIDRYESPQNVFVHNVVADEDAMYISSMFTPFVFKVHLK